MLGPVTRTISACSALAVEKATWRHSFAHPEYASYSMVDISVLMCNLSEMALPDKLMLVCLSLTVSVLPCIQKRKQMHKYTKPSYPHVLVFYFFLILFFN